MKIIYNNILPFPGFIAMMLFGVIFARKKYRPLGVVTINHEGIHDAQAKECNGYFRYYWKYLRCWVKYGYRNIPFEREAYDNEENPDYLNKREPFAWKQYEK